MRALKDAGAGVAHNPTSNLKLGAGVAPVAKMLELGVDVGIGTDGAASNNDLDMFEEMRLAALLAKGIGGDPDGAPGARRRWRWRRGSAPRRCTCDHLTGSLEPGKRADLIVARSRSACTTCRRFDRDPNGIYSQIVYASKSTDVVDVMCNGRWLMRDRAAADARRRRSCARAAQDMARAHRRVPWSAARRACCRSWSRSAAPPSRRASRCRSRRASPDAERCARGDRDGSADGHSIDATTTSTTPTGRSTIRSRAACAIGKTSSSTRPDRSPAPAPRLTLTGRTREERFGSVLLFRSRYLAPAAHSPRFYREYFRPATERVVEKDRRRWLVAYRGVEFYVHLDRLVAPRADGYFIEVKSRTWSRRDARDKAAGDHRAARAVRRAARTTRSATGTSISSEGRGSRAEGRGPRTEARTRRSEAGIKIRRCGKVVYTPASCASLLGRPCSLWLAS